MIGNRSIYSWNDKSSCEVFPVTKDSIAVIAKKRTFWRPKSPLAYFRGSAIWPCKCQGVSECESSRPPRADGIMRARTKNAWLPAHVTTPSVRYDAPQRGGSFLGFCRSQFAAAKILRIHLRPAFPAFSRAPRGLPAREGPLAAASPQTPWLGGEQSPRFAW